VSVWRISSSSRLSSAQNRDVGYVSNADPQDVPSSVNAKPVMIAEIVLDEMRQKALDNQRAVATVVDQRDFRPSLTRFPVSLQTRF
jgi:hypothetical protein